MRAEQESGILVVTSVQSEQASEILVLIANVQAEQASEIMVVASVQAEQKNYDSCRICASRI